MNFKGKTFAQYLKKFFFDNFFDIVVKSLPYIIKLWRYVGIGKADTFKERNVGKVRLLKG